jgi:hypothetical protein
LLFLLLAVFSIAAFAEEPVAPADTVEGTVELAPQLIVEPTPPAPTYSLPSEISVADKPNDGGQAIQITWKKPEETDLEILAATLVIWRSDDSGSAWIKLTEARPTQGRYVDSYSRKTAKKPEHILKDKTTYRYKLSVLQDPAIESSVFEAQSKGQWLNNSRNTTLIATIIYVFLVGLFIAKARGGDKMYVRPIAGIDAVEEAVGRATEMGKPVLYVPGIGEIQEVATLAALTILAPIAQKVAEYNSQIMVPNRDPVVFTVAQEVVREAFLKAGTPDAYREDDIFFLSGRQFAYAAAVSGIMMREKPGTNFFFGVFYAESLILAETGAATGAIQIAGTDKVAQLPFFIAACDYTLIGEELYAASAYLGDDPVLIGSLKALDWAKVVIMATLAVGTVLSFWDITWLVDVL